MQLSYIGQAFSQPTIYDLIFSCLPPPTIMRCGRTCRVIYVATKDFNTRAYNINRHLSRFFNDPEGFRSLQAQTAALISGSNALQFLDRSHYADSDLDVFVFAGTVREIGRWLINHEGYSFTPRPEQSPEFEKAAVEMSPVPGEPEAFEVHEAEYRSTGIIGVHSFSKAPDLTIQLITTRRTPMDCILRFHSTCVMNVIAFDAAYSLYPRATFDLRRGLSLAHISPREAKALAKYGARGWVIHSTIWPHEEDTLKPLFKVDVLRRMIDRDSWVIPFDTTDITLRSPFNLSSPPFTEDPAAFSSWTLCGRTSLEYDMSYRFLSSTILKYDYVNDDPGFLEVMIAFFQKQGSLEHSKFRGLPKDVEAWTWWDASLPGFYKAYLKRLEDRRMDES
ncbi:uncharacterized protein LACBIDRAFT_301449 [Laccaria bicolor S238N-H82]|uniref:Predicted protein n=1 Tax=Laccaria bicolor (strain S238N-H82 / ATCC MYA-4686) TaxID=486041 RepID=B0CNK1_LACBS|nr:uncharacterized protein LACBIDRAFT_301449 [Laccaria bicolor S238N-H82]EDR15939.1 predicted protein [Laccaria bicolor S238N-H82]|eukprot:XP_001874147.1 predicted protein [Laccaria bicolor S238N-H82]